MKVAKRIAFFLYLSMLFLPSVLFAQIDWTQHTIAANFDGAYTVYAIDVDSDGDMDVLGSSYVGDDITWWENDGDEAFTEHTIEGNFDNARCVFAIDLDSDGDTDVLGAAMDADDITWWENDGDEDFTGHTIDGDFDGAFSVYAADVDGDDDIDVIGSAMYDFAFKWWENDGDEDFTEHVLADSMDWAVDCFAADVDSDGDMDILGAGGTRIDGYITWWENDGDENFTEHTLVSDFSYAHAVYAKDVDGDDDMDVLGAAYEDDAVMWWENDGEEVFTADTIAVLDGVQDVFAIDIDFDGDIDVLAASRSLSDIKWWENDGENQEEWIEYTINNNFNNARSVYATDMDNDGDVDVLCAAYAADDIAWWESDLDPPGDCNVEGVVTDAETEDVIEDAEVTFANLTEVTDEDGYYRIEGLHPDLHTVTIEADGYEIYTETGIEINDGENDYDFQLVPLVLISGTITDSETDAAIEDANITFGEDLFTAVTDEEGFYSIEDVESGTYDVLIEADGYFNFEDDDVEVEEPENVLDFAIDILSGDLTGVVSDGDTQELLFGVTVTVIDPETQETYRQVQTNEDGEYTAEALHDDVRYLVTAELEDYAPQDTQEVLIRWNQDNELDFELEPFWTSDIQGLQTVPNGRRWAATSGIVTQGTNVTDTEHTIIYIQDDSGWGIQIYDEDPTDPENNINRGDEVSVTGYLEEVDDMTIIINFEIEVINNENPLPDPLNESTGEMATLFQREGTWAQISGQINRDPPGEGDYSLIVDDGSGQCEVRIIESTGIDLSEYSADDWGTFTGVICLSRQGLRIIPNMQEDVSQLNIHPPSNLVANYMDVIRGDTLEVEVTLSWDHDHLDDWIRINIYRDGEHIGNTQQNTWMEVLVIPIPEQQSITWEYEVTALYDECETEPSNPAEVFVELMVTPQPYSGIPTEWSLEAVYPNPFNPELSIIVALPAPSGLDIRIYNILGKQIALLANGRYPAGYKIFNFKAADHASGIYFLKVQVPERINEIRKVVLIR
ncbi:MAG: carboxypeptidase regulatory-like domain-containing protein [Candidatus Electryonea clarkiae]|nr:carboxypeptidase regulatory-like domain-containing protein [Candidatus Electryonea clarkiae]MDP8285137.1 carboxypeptidase regulatory-like domain-containing protein [Candidatus Electryonea clarkiae]